MTRTQIGVTLPQFTSDPLELVDGAKRAEAAGLDSVWLFDHLWPLTGGKRRSMFEAWTAVAFVAAATERVTVGTLVTRSSLRRPVMVGKMAATVAAIAPGRLIVGIGSGDSQSRSENSSFGLPYFEGERRVAQLESTVRVVRSYLHGPQLDHTDPFTTVNALPTSPAAHPAPEVWVGGRTAATVRVAGHYADGWNAWGASPRELVEGAEIVRAAAGGRPVRVTWGGLVLMAATDADAVARLGARDPSDYLVGSPATIRARLNELAGAGADHLIVTFPHPTARADYEKLAAATS